MEVFSSTCVSDSLSDKRQSKRGSADQKRSRGPKWLGLVALGVTFAMSGAAVEAQQTAKVVKIGWLIGGSTSSQASRLKAIGSLLSALGYVEGNNIASEFRYADSKADRLPALADELVRLKVDVILAAGPPAALAAKNATRTIPIVFYYVAGPVEAGLVDSLARPGGNVTGFTVITEVLAGKRLELLKETVPKLSRAAVLWNPENSGNALQWKESQLPARGLGLQLHSMEVSSANKFESAFKEAAKARSAGLAMAPDPLFTSNFKLITGLATKYRLPAIADRGEFVDNGGLMSYGADDAEQNRRVAVMIDKVLKGTKPAEIPVEQPTKFELVINFKTAKTLGLTIPPMVLMRAQRVIK